ncbi:MAG: DNA-binding protein WhiA [Clostridiales bacterium]|nr:DNA-binding protein WhiA [Clostridiales bacterium]
MSYASETKNELARIEPEKKCCMLAEIAGFMRFAGSVGLAGGGKFRMVMTTPNLAVVRHYKKLIRSYFDVDTDIEVGSPGSNARGLKGAKAKEYIIRIEPENNSEMILREMGILIVREGMNTLSDGIYEGLIKTKCCRKAYLRGAFLGAGTINNPESSHHFEINTSSGVCARELRRLINTFVDINARIVERKTGYGVYLKARDQIADTLAIMGASKAYFDYQDKIIRKDAISTARKIEQLDLVNMDKAIQAAERQVSDIQKIAAKQGLESLSPKLQEVAMLRLDNPDLGIEALGQLLSPPLSKSGVNNRLRRISEIAKGL